MDLALALALALPYLPTPRDHGAAAGVSRAWRAAAARAGTFPLPHGPDTRAAHQARAARGLTAAVAAAEHSAAEADVAAAADAAAATIRYVTVECILSAHGLDTRYEVTVQRRWRAAGDATGAPGAWRVCGHSDLPEVARRFSAWNVMSPDEICAYVGAGLGRDDSRVVRVTTCCVAVPRNDYYRVNRVTV